METTIKHQSWRLHIARSAHIFIKFPELCNRIPVERTTRPPLFTRHPPSDGSFCEKCVVNWTSPRGDATELGRYVICKPPSAICVTARGLARPWGAMELQMETVCVCVCVLTLPQLKGNQ